MTTTARGRDEPEVYSDSLYHDPVHGVWEHRITYRLHGMMVAFREEYARDEGWPQSEEGRELLAEARRGYAQRTVEEWRKTPAGMKRGRLL